MVTQHKKLKNSNMKKVYLFTSLVVLSILLGSLSLLKTQLQVTVLDDAGNFQKGASVKIYLNDADYEADKPVLEPQLTDKKGRTKFVGLEPVDYYILVEKGSKNNVLGGERTGELVEGKINKVNVIISD